VHDVHHVHVWSLTPARHLVSLHAAVEAGADRQATLVAIKALLVERYGIRHATIQLEARGECADEPP
jgi:cobalt-zinc-cadmium efflux system protein